jgi:hypothetical protein
MLVTPFPDYVVTSQKMVIVTRGDVVTGETNL